jgi:thiol-disulfide isomerase/thioredoxin
MYPVSAAPAGIALVVFSNLVVFSSVAGCRPADSPTAPAPSISMTAHLSAEPGATADPAVGVTVEVRSWSEVEELIADHHGKVVVVDVWSTWCFPCLQEFHHLVQLQRVYRDRVACISVNIDYTGLEDQPPEASQEKVLTFLRQQQATFQNVISSDPDQVVLSTLQVSSIPAVLVYDRQGELRKQFVNQDGEYGDEGFEYQADIIPVVDRLLED